MLWGQKGESGFRERVEWHHLEKVKQEEPFRRLKKA